MDEFNIPIDIHTNKLLDWLVSRRHVKKEWQKDVLEVREKINRAIQDMPARDDMVQLLSGQHINYFHCLKIVEILKETEADTKNVFGFYSSQRMKDWQDIVSAYQKDNLYLAEASQILIRNVSYEIPSLKKQLVKLQTIQMDCEKKIRDYSKNETTVLKEFQTACDQLGIPGKNIKNELMGLVKELPKIHEASYETLKKVKPAIELYQVFHEFLAGSGNQGDILKTLKFIIENGNTTTYQYLTGKIPTKIEVFEDKSDTENTSSSNEIDFGDDIDFGIDSETIDFDVTNENLDWSVKTDDEFEIIEPVIEKNDGIAIGNNALTLLDNPSTRENIINNLLELNSFLLMRKLEMSTSENDLLSMSQLQNAPSFIQIQTVDSIENLLIVLNETIDNLTNKRTQHLHNLKHSMNYVDILTLNLNQKLSQIDRLKSTKIVMEKKIIESQQEMKSINQFLNVTIDRTKEIQGHIEKDISIKYKGRIVNIVGGVNMI